MLVMVWASGGTPAATASAEVPSFRVHAGANSETLAVEASFPANSAGRLGLEDGGERFVRDVEVEQRGHWTSVRHPEQGVELPPCAKGCRLRYRFLLRDAAEALGDPQAAAVFGGAYVSPPSTWLLHPKEATLAGYRLQVTAPEGVHFLSGLPPADAADTYISTSGLRVAPLCGFGAWRVLSLDVEGSHVTLAIAPVHFAMGDGEMERWVAEATRAVSLYYQRFPVEQLLLMVVPDRGQHLSGFTLGEGGASILLRLGTTMPAALARNHWVLTHELMHLGFPSLRRTHLWMEEGMAVFGEPIVRVRAGMVEEAVLWSEWLEQGPLGLARAGEGGMETTHSWARTYWGGAVFWLVADVTLRERTGNARSADDVLRALVAAGGNVSRRWELEDVLRVADEAAGQPVFSELFHSMGEAPGAPDLQALFQRLGVSLRNGAVVYDDSAPLAGVRRAMVAGGHSKVGGSVPTVTAP
jgi:hypothetical protein